MNLVQRSRALMQKQTRKNKAPAWSLTEMAVLKGKELSKRYHTNTRLVLASLYLAHTIFSTIVHGKVQKNHTTLSAAFAKRHLKRWKVSPHDQRIILNAIESHHGKVATESKVAEVMKNAECFKFVTLKGCLIYLADLQQRGYAKDDAIDKVLLKMESKRKLLTLKPCIREAEKNCTEIRKLFLSVK